MIPEKYFYLTTVGGKEGVGSGGVGTRINPQIAPAVFCDIFGVINQLFTRLVFEQCVYSWWWVSPGAGCERGMAGIHWPLASPENVIVTGNRAPMALQPRRHSRLFLAPTGTSSLHPLSCPSFGKLPLPPRESWVEVIQAGKYFILLPEVLTEGVLQFIQVTSQLRGKWDFPFWGLG